MNAYLTKCLSDACRGCTVCQESGSHGSEVSGAASECAREDTEDVEEVEDSEGGCSGEEASNSGDAREGDSREGEKKKRKAHRGTRSSRARKKRRADSVVRKAGGIPREAVQRFIAQSAEAAAKATLDRAVETMIRREVKVRADHRQRVRILEKDARLRAQRHVQRERAADRHREKARAQKAQREYMQKSPARCRQRQKSEGAASRAAHMRLRKEKNAVGYSERKVAARSHASPAARVDQGSSGCRVWQRG